MYYDDKTTIFLDGKWLKAEAATTSLFAQTLHYGSGVFEGIRSYRTLFGAKVFKARAHYDRLLYSAEKMHIQLPYSAVELEQLTYELLERNGLQDAYIRPLVYLGEQMSLAPCEQVHLMLSAWSWERYLGDKLLALTTSTFQRPNPKSCFVEAKVTGHYTNSILATTEAKSRGYDEALMLDTNGHVAEGPGANFFFEKDERLYTPPLGNIFPGITRQTIFELAEADGISITEKHFTPAEVYEADGAFFTGTAAEVAGIKSLDGHAFQKSWEETLGAKLAKAYHAATRETAKLQYA